jgi:ABC-type branched-subunit amino acid transport system substrate-binding protein
LAEEPIRGEAPSGGVASEQGSHRGPTRRQMVLGAGVALGAVALSGTPFLGGFLSSLSRVVRPAVGVVAPPSTRYPDLLGQLAAGVRRGLAANGQADAPVFARTAANSAPSSAATLARELIERDRVNLVLVYANPTQTAFLGALAKETGVPVIVVDPGAHIVTSADADSRVLSHSLGYWQSTWALGSWSAGAVGPRSYVISSLYESGFDTLHAFEHGLARAGGTMAGTSITHVRPGDTAAAARAAATSGADSLYVAASGHEADDILRAIAADKTASKMPLLLPGLSADRLGVAPRLSACTALTWPAAEKSPFEMLGEDVGALVAAAVDGGRAALPTGATSHAGARGDIKLDLATGRTDVAVRIHSVSASGGSVTLKPRGAATNTSQATAFADDIVPKLRTGWLDVYGSTL